MLPPKSSAELNNKLKNAFLQRAQALGLIASARDEAAMHFWTGAAVALEIFEHHDAAASVAHTALLEWSQTGAGTLLELAEFRKKNETLGGRLLNIFSRHPPNRVGVSIFRSPRIWD